MGIFVDSDHMLYFIGVVCVLLRAFVYRDQAGDHPDEPPEEAVAGVCAAAGV